MHLQIFAAATATMFLLVQGHAQQRRWASADDHTAKYIIDMERKWAEGVCVDNGVVARLLADDFQGTFSRLVRARKPLPSSRRFSTTAAWSGTAGREPWLVWA